LPHSEAISGWLINWATRNISFAMPIARAPSLAGSSTICQDHSHFHRFVVATMELFSIKQNSVTTQSCLYWISTRQENQLVFCLRSFFHFHRRCSRDDKLVLNKNFRDDPELSVYRISARQENQLVFCLRSLFHFHRLYSRDDGIIFNKKKLLIHQEHFLHILVSVMELSIFISILLKLQATTTQSCW